MSPNQQKSLKKKIQVWKLKSADEKIIIRNQFERFQNLPEVEKQLLRDSYEKFKNLPLEKQQSLTTQYRKTNGA